MRKYKRVDLSEVRTYLLRDRKNKVSIKDFASKVKKNSSFDAFMESIPNISAGKDFREFVKAIINAKKRGKPVIFAMGAHVIKCGLSPIIISVIEKKIITAIVFNGAAGIHDYEISLIWGNLSGCGCHPS